MTLRAATVALVLVVLAAAAPAQTAPRDVLRRVDHLIYATPDLERTVDALQRRLGVRAAPAGHSPGRGTRSALLSLGDDGYLEIVAPDTGQPGSNRSPWWMPALREPRLVQWAAKGSELEALRAAAVTHGIPLGEVVSGSRVRPDGVRLTWRFTSPRRPVADGVAPFFIDWGTTPHPARSAPHGVRLVALRAEHPDLERVRGILRQLGVPLSIRRGTHPALVATLEGPRGRMELR